MACCAIMSLCCLLPFCSDDINIVAVLKAMGAESDQEVVQLIGPDEQLAALLMASIQVGPSTCFPSGGGGTSNQVFRVHFFSMLAT